MSLNDFFATIFELLGYAGTFSDDLFQEELYITIGLTDVIVSLILVITFYFIINRPNFSKFRHWLIILAINFLICFCIGIFVPQNIFVGLGIDYEIMQYVLFGLKNAIVATLLFIIWTYCLKWWNSNAKGTPKLFFGKF